MPGRDWRPLLSALLYPLPVWAFFAFFIDVSFTYISYPGMVFAAVCSIAAPVVILAGILIDCWPRLH